MTIKRLHFATATFLALALLSSSKLEGQVDSAASHAGADVSHFRISAANENWNGPQPQNTDRTTLRDIPLPCSITPRIDTVDYAYVFIDTLTRYQTMDGWGASSNFYEENLVRFDPAMRAQLFDHVYGELGANIMCIRLYSTFQTSKGGPYNWNAMSAQRMILGEALSRGRINTIWLKVSSPPGWMKDNGSEKNGGHVKPEHYQDYADYLSYYIRHMRSDYGFRINAVSIFNEPGFAANYESTSTTPSEYRDVLKVVAATFRRDSLDDVGVIGPEVGHITQGWSYFTTILSDTVAAAALSCITTHQYGDQRLLYGTGPADNWEGLRDLAALHGKRVWETEMFVGGPGMPTRDIDEALRVALLMWTAVTRGNVCAWHYWQYHHPLEDNASQGVISLDGNSALGVFPRFHAMMQWMRHIPPGAARIKAESSNPDLYSLAFIHKDTLVTMVFNRTERQIEAGFIFPLNAGHPRHYRTSATENHATGPDPTPGDVTTFLTISPKSISTLVMPLVSTSVVRPDAAASVAFDVFPNPAESRISLRLDNVAPQSQVLVTDLLGRVYARRSLEEMTQERMLHVETGSWPSGAYRVSLIGNSAVLSRMIIKR